MATVDAIRNITIRASTPGADQATQSLNNLTAAQNRVAASADQLSASMAVAQKMLSDNVAQLNALKSANDNAATGFGDFAKGASEVSSNLASTVESTLSTISHLKLLAVAAYAVSPAFRSITNTGVATALSALPPVLATATSAAASFGSRLLALSAPLTVPIAAAVVGWKSLNYVWTTGSTLLDKYAGSVRSFFAADVSDNLAKLTKLQPDDSISQAQIQYATELGARLATAKQTLSDFWTVEINVNDAALKLQSVWVNIVEVMASAVTWGGNLFDTLQSGAQAFGNSSIWAKITSIGAGLPGLGSLPGTINPNNLPQPAADTSDADNMAAARKRLAAGMGGGGTTYPYARYSQSISDLANPPKPDTSNPDQTDSYDRAIQGIKDQIDQLALEADGASKTSAAVEELKVAHTANIAAMKAGIPVTDDMRAQWKTLGDQIAAYTIQLNQAKVVQEETFKSATMFASPGDLAAANAAKQIDPTNWQAHLNDLGPQMAAFNAQLTQARDLADSFADSFGQAMLQGKTAAQALNTALNSLASSLISMISKQLVNNALGSLLGSLKIGPNYATTATQSNPTTLGSIYARGAAFSGGREIHPYALGGIVSDIVVSPTLFPMANGMGLMGEAGPEAVMPLTRTSGGQLGVRTNGGGGGGGNTQVINTITIENYTGAQATQTQSKNSSGGTDTRIVLGSGMSQVISAGGVDKSMASRYGLKPVGQQR